MRLSTWRRWSEAWVSLRIAWSLALVSTVVFAVLCIVELVEEG